MLLGSTETCQPVGGLQHGKETLRADNVPVSDSLLCCCRVALLNHRTPLHEAVCLGSTSMVNLLLHAGSDPNMGHPKEGSPLLQVRALCLCFTNTSAHTTLDLALHFTWAVGVL